VVYSGMGSDGIRNWALGTRAGGRLSTPVTLGGKVGGRGLHLLITRGEGDLAGRPREANFPPEGGERVWGLRICERRVESIEGGTLMPNSE